MSDSCSSEICRFSILRQIENGFFSRPYTSAGRPASASLFFSAELISSTSPALRLWMSSSLSSTA